jgi:hypothetical protein
MALQRFTHRTNQTWSFVPRHQSEHISLAEWSTRRNSDKAVISDIVENHIVALVALGEVFLV